MAYMEISTLDSLRIVLDPIGQTGVALALMLVMFSVALGLRVDDFSFLRDKPLLFLGGVTAQVVVLPLATFLLILAGATTPQKMAKKRPSIIVGAFVIGMMLTPPDVISQSLLAVPLWLLFEIGLIMSRIFIKRPTSFTPASDIAFRSRICRSRDPTSCGDGTRRARARSSTSSVVSQNTPLRISHQYTSRAATCLGIRTCSPTDSITSRPAALSS